MQHTPPHAPARPFQQRGELCYFFVGQRPGAQIAAVASQRRKRQTQKSENPVFIGKPMIKYPYILYTSMLNVIQHEILITTLFVAKIVAY